MNLTRSEIDELIRLEDGRQRDTLPDGDRLTRLETLAVQHAVGMARLLKAAGKGLKIAYARCPIHGLSWSDCDADCWAAALVEIGGGK